MMPLSAGVLAAALLGVTVTLAVLVALPLLARRHRGHLPAIKAPVVKFTGYDEQLATRARLRADQVETLRRRIAAQAVGPQATHLSTVLKFTAKGRPS